MESLLLLGQVASITAKLIVATLLIWTYRRTGRISSLHLGIAWLISALVVLGDALKHETAVIVLYSLFSSILFFGSFMFLIEEGILTIKRPEIWALPPLIGTLYGLLLGTGWESRVGIPYGISAFYIVLSGVSIASAEGDFKWARRAGIILALFGLHEMDYPFLRNVQWFAPIGFALGAILTLASAYAMAKMVLSERFVGKSVPGDVDVKPGIRLVNRTKYRSLLEGLKSYPVLAFLREPVNFDAWRSYMLTAVGGDGRIHPTNLARIADLVSRYLREASSAGITGVVVIDSVEFLVIHNGFQPVLKFLATLRDMTLVNGALLIVIIEEEAWEPKELSMLKRILVGE